MHLHMSSNTTHSLKNAFLNDNEICGVDKFLEQVKNKKI